MEGILSMKENNILNILRKFDLTKDKEQICQDIHSIMYPGPFFHIFLKGKGKGYYQYEGWDRWGIRDKDTQYYFCKLCHEKIKEEKIKKLDPNNIKGCCPPSEIWNLDFLLGQLRTHIGEIYPSEYEQSIGLLWFYTEWIIDKDSFSVRSSLESIKKWQIQGDMFIRIYRWLIRGDMTIKHIFSLLLAASMLDLEFDAHDRIYHGLKKKE